MFLFIDLLILFFEAGSRDNKKRVDDLVISQIQVGSANCRSTGKKTGEVPSTEVPSAEVPIAKVPIAKVPIAKVPSAEIPTAEVPTNEVPTVKVPIAEIPIALVSTAEVPTIQKYQIQLVLVLFREETQAFSLVLYMIVPSRFWGGLYYERNVTEIYKLKWLLNH